MSSEICERLKVLSKRIGVMIKIENSKNNIWEKEIIVKILFVYPRYPITYWGFQHALKFISKKASFPPLGLLTVAAMLPEHYEKKLVDMNVSQLKDKDILWADYVFISAMVVQKESARDIVNRCQNLNVRTVAGGPLFTSEPEEFADVDHLLLDEGELTVPPFIHDLESGPLPIFTQRRKWAIYGQPLCLMESY